MFRSFFFPVIVLATLCAHTPALGSTILAKATLTGAQEVPTPVATDAIGQATLDIDHFGNYFFRLEVEGIATTDINTGAAGGLHIHNGPAGSNGPIILNLADDTVELMPVGLTGFVWTAAGLISDPPNFVALLHAGNTYVNVHTLDFPGGEIRGQLSVVPLPSAVFLLGTALAGMAGFKRLRRRRTSAEAA